MSVLQRVAPTIGLTLAVLAVSAFIARRARRAAPPGPPCRPWLGIDLKLLPKLEPWKTYAGWGKHYGPILSFHVLGRRIIVLNSFQVASELLNKRASIYSDRPLKYMYDVLMGRGTSVFNIPASDPRHRVYRKLLHGSLNLRAIQSYQDVQEDEARAFLRRIAEDSDNFLQHVKRNAVAVIMRITYGYHVKDEDPFVSIIEESFRISSLGAAQGKWLVDQFPILRFLPSWFPGAGFKRQAREWCEQLDNMSSAPLEWTKEQMALGSAGESFASTYLSDPSIEEFNVQKCATGLYAGGADTIASAMSSFILAMCLNPDVQARAQREVDSVTNRDRLPMIGDIENLPYLKNLLKEVLRWAPVAPLALPHCLAQDDEYQGYHLPKGATIYANLWGMLHDPNLYNVPDEFNPERFIVEAGERIPPDPLDWVFGFGKRICPGLHFAQASLLLNMACVLSTFDIDLPVGSDGTKYRPEVAFTTGITSHPKPFSCKITLRTGAEKLVL